MSLHVAAAAGKIRIWKRKKTDRKKKEKAEKKRQKKGPRFVGHLAPLLTNLVSLLEAS